MKQTIEREVPELDYEIAEGNLKHIQGQVLTIIEVAITDPQQLKAVKSIIKRCFNDKLTYLFDMYGRNTGLEMPNYSSVGLPEIE